MKINTFKKKLPSIKKKGKPQKYFPTKDEWENILNGETVDDIDRYKEFLVSICMENHPRKGKDFKTLDNDTQLDIIEAIYVRGEILKVLMKLYEISKEEQEKFIELFDDVEYWNNLG